MPTPRLFANCPPFPNTVPVADIPTISFAKISNHDELEENLLWDACQDHGFFLLDLKDSTLGDQVVHDAEKMFDLNTTTLELDREILNDFVGLPPKDTLGYKRAGLLKTDDGKMDTIELYAIGQDDILGNTAPRKHPKVVESRRKDCGSFFRNCHAVLMVLLAIVNKHLDLPPGTLANLCPLNKPSPTSLRLIHTHGQTVPETKRISFGNHTDIGIMTLLFNVAGGLQILPAGSDNVWDNWQFVRPLPGCAVVNIGDTLVQWTGGVVRSVLHRVISAPGDQAFVARQSVPYLLRAENNASMRRIKQGRVIPPLAEGEEDESRSVVEWSTWRQTQIMLGKLMPRTNGGRSLRP